MNAGYFEVSRHERATLLAAKESAATMVARLFAAGLVEAIRFTDDKGTQAKATLLMTNEELVHAAVYVVDPEDASTILLKLAEVQRGVIVVPPPRVHHDIHVQRYVDVVVVEAPVIDANKQIVGMVQTTFSLEHEKAASAVMESRALFGAAAVGVLLAVVLLALVHTLVIKRLALLAAALKRFEEGESALEVDVLLDASKGDEVGELARAFDAMTQAIAIREQRVSQRHRELRRVLDNAAEGFLTVSCEGVMSAERSLVLDDWFGEASEEMSFFDYIDRVAPEVTPWLRLGWSSLRDDFMPCEVVLDQLGRCFSFEGRALELEFRPIHELDVLVQVLVVVRDVTERVERDRAELAQREGMAIFRRLLADRNGFEELMSEAGRLVDDIVTESGADFAHVTRAIHTLKGVTAIFEIESVSRFCHELEQRMVEERRGPSASDRHQLSVLWAAIIVIHVQLGGGATGDRLEVLREDYDRLLSELTTGVDRRKTAAFVRSWQFERASTRLSRILAQLSSIARRLGKDDVDLRSEVSPPDLRLPPERWAGVWTAFSHLLRNSLDHGIETRSDRVLAGKTGAGSVSVAIVANDVEVAVSITDDGRGIAWDKIRVAAAARGLPTLTHSDLEEALFVDAVSSRTVVTEVSGRGVGMGAVREVIGEHGGSMSITTETGQGTTFCLRFPNAMLRSDACEAA